MIRNYIKIAFRNFLKYRIYSLINIFGLGNGVAIFFIAMEFSTYHYSWDNHISKVEDIYRVQQKFNDGGTTAHCSPPIKDVLVNDYSEIQLATSFGISRNQELFIDDKQIVGEQFLYVDKNFFEMFDVEFISNTKENVISDFEKNPYQAIVTKEYAKVLFGDEPALGKVFQMDRGTEQPEYTVSAIVKKFPETSHFTFNFILSKESVPFFKEEADNWNYPIFYTYVYIPNREKANEFKKVETLDKFIEKHFPPKFGGPEAHLPVVPLKDIHLHSHAYNELGNNSDIVLIIIVTIIGVLILFLATINFINLTTAHATRRAKEVGMRKTLGATRKLLANQFIGEAIIFSILSVIVGVILAELLLPQFNAYLNESLTIHYFQNWFTIPFLIITALALGIISGIYPAFVLSSFNPVKALKDAKGGSMTTGGFLVRKGLVILQFLVVSLLLVTIITMQSQLSYLAHKDVGYDNKNLVYVRSSERMMEKPENYLSFIDEIRNSGAVVDLAAIENWAYQAVDFEGMKPGDREGSIILTTSADFAKTLKLQLLAGRFLDKDNISDLDHIIFNETAAGNFGWTPEEAIGKTVKLFEGDSTYQVIGVFKDYHFDDLLSKIEPLGMITTPNNNFWSTMVRIPENDTEKAKEAITAAWKRFDDGWPFELYYSEEQLSQSLKTIENVQAMMSQLTLIGIFIACMGLWGLTSFATERRKKEIGIRKVMGASVSNLIVLVVTEFIILVAIATTIGVVGGYYAADFLLQNFAYRISIDAEIIILAILISIVIAIVTVSYQALKTAFVNPVESIRIE